MITEDFVSFEVAELLKEKGFDGECETSYYISNEGCENAVSVGDFTKVRPWREALIAAPTLQMAIKWLRESYGIFIGIKPYDSYYEDKYEFLIYKKENTVIFDWEVLDIEDSLFEGYENTVEAALKYSLENLI